jgi:hypothetical protein
MTVIKIYFQVKQFAKKNKAGAFNLNCKENKDVVEI